VLAVVSGLSDMQVALNIVWDKLVPGMSKSALPADPIALAELRSSTAGLRLRPSVETAGATSKAEALAASLANKIFRFGDNWAGLDTMAFDFRPECLEFRYRITRKKATGNGLTGPLEPPRSSGRRSLRCGYGEWIDGISYVDGQGPKKAACSGAWTSPDVFSMKVFNRETPFVLSLTFRFEGELLRVEVKNNVGFGPTEFAPLEGYVR
jgi:hypothetical protein